MGKADYARVVDDMRLADGTLWALPVTLAVAAAAEGRPRGAGRRVRHGCWPSLDVEEVFAYDPQHEAERCFGTTDEAHPGVARIYGSRASTWPVR